MKKLVVVLLSLSILIFSNFAMASVNGMWNMESIEKKSLKIGQAKPIIEIENISDVWVFKDDGSFEFKQDASSKIPLFVGTWSQKGSSFNVDINYEQMRIFIESELLSGGLPATATIKKLRIFGSEKKTWTLKGKYQIKADLVFPDSSKGTLDINGSFTGTLPYDTAEYFPLGQGDTWTFHEIEHEGNTVEEDTETYAIMGTEKTSGKFAAKKVELDDGNYELITNTNGIQFYKDYETDTEDGGVIEETFDTYSPPIMYVPPRLSVGTRHSFKSTLIHKSSTGFNVTAKITGEMVVEGMEDITVAAGTFQDCLKIKLTRHVIVSKLQFEGHTEVTMWLAKGVGTLKEMSSDTEFTGGVFEGESSQDVELISATVGGVNYP
jgi:hypothetical protein